MCQKERGKYGFKKRVVNQNLFTSWLSRVSRKYQKREKRKKNEYYSKRCWISKKLRLRSPLIGKLGRIISLKLNKNQNLWKNTQTWSSIQYQNESKIERRLLDLNLKNLSQKDPNLVKAINQRSTKAQFKIQHEMRLEMSLMRNLKSDSLKLEKSMRRLKNKSKYWSHLDSLDLKVKKSKRIFDLKVERGRNKKAVHKLKKSCNSWNWSKISVNWVTRHLDYHSETERTITMIFPYQCRNERSCSKDKDWRLRILKSKSNMVFDQWRVFINPSQLENEKVRRRNASQSHSVESWSIILLLNKDERSLLNR